jgi:transglutaminase-like putative cysteine protease
VNMAAPMRLKFKIELAYEVNDPGADFIFNIQAARTARQRVLTEDLHLSSRCEVSEHTDTATGSRFLRVGAGPGALVVNYTATVDIAHAIAEPAGIYQMGVRSLPGAVMPFVYPSRYCESDRLLRFAGAEFGNAPPGYALARHIRDWVAKNVVFTSNSTSGETSACDTLLERQGVCRDFAHLMIALCRAMNIPSRFATGIDYGADPALGPQDFHAYVEVYLGGRWWIFDPSGTAIPMGFVRLGTGRDAADAAFCTMFGPASMTGMSIDIKPVTGADGIAREPVHTGLALSTDDGA